MTTLDEVVRRSRETEAERDARRLAEIEKLHRFKLSTWTEESEAFQIRRRQAMRGCP